MTKSRFDSNAIQLSNLIIPSIGGFLFYFFKTIQLAVIFDSLLELDHLHLIPVETESSLLDGNVQLLKKVWHTSLLVDVGLLACHIRVERWRGTTIT